jgi:hypothetical protein
VSDKPSTLDTDEYKAATHTFWFEPEALTEAQIEVLRSVDTKLGERAARKRQDAVMKAAAARHRAAMGEPPKKANHVTSTADVISDTALLSVVEPKLRIRQLEARNAQLDAQLDQLTQKFRDLETRLLLIEAREAVHDDR